MTLPGSVLVHVDGAPLAPELTGLLASAYVDDSLRMPDAFGLTFRDPQRNVLQSSGVKIGSVVTVSVTTAAAPAAQELLTGEVTALEAEFDSAGTFTVVRGYDPAHRLFRGRRSEGYTQMTASDIATAVARRAQLPVGTVRASSVVFDHVSQAGVTDWEFLEGLAREIGYEVAVRDGKFCFTTPTPAADAPDGGGGRDPLVLALGTDLLRFRAVVTAAEQVSEVQVRGWDVAEKKALVASAPAATRSAVLPGITPASLAERFGSPTYVGTDTPFRTQAEVDGAAAALAEQIAGAHAEFEGLSRGNPRLRAGAAISVTNVGAPFDGKYTITSSRHRYDPRTGYTTAFTVSGRQERSLYGLSSGGGGSRTAAGVVVALVSAVDDPLEAGRVQLTFPWLSDDLVTDWARTVQPGAGKGRGATVLPEVGDEVLVAFEQGDARRPYVLGGLFNGVDTMPEGSGPLVDSSSGAVNRRSWVSRRGHRIDLHDQDGRTEGVSLSTADGALSLVLDTPGTTVTVHADGTVLVEGSKGVTVDAGSATLALKGGDITLTAATGGVSIDGGAGAVQVTGTTLSLAGSASAELKGGGTCSISAGLVKIN